MLMSTLSLSASSRFSPRLTPSSNASRWNCTGCYLEGSQSRGVLAERLQVSVEVIDRILDGWPGVFSDSERRIIGYWGLSIAAAYTSPHQLTIDGQKLSAWCAWDTLFLPQLLGTPAEVESKSPVKRAVSS